MALIQQRVAAVEALVEDLLRHPRVSQAHPNFLPIYCYRVGCLLAKMPAYVAGVQDLHPSDLGILKAIDPETPPDVWPEFAYQFANVVGIDLGD